MKNNTLPLGWIAAGSHPQDYVFGVDKDIKHNGESSGFIKSLNDTPSGFGTLMQQFKANNYRGKRLQFKGYVKSEDVKDWAGLWMRIDDSSQETVGFDNMQSRPIKGTVDWKEYAVVLDVPSHAIEISFGVLLYGKGHVWIDDLEFNVVDTSVATTYIESSAPEIPQNLNFEA